MQLLYHIIAKIRHYKIKNSLQKKGALLRVLLIDTNRASLA